MVIPGKLAQLARPGIHEFKGIPASAGMTDKREQLV
jgi:hypothetical protein